MIHLPNSRLQRIAAIALLAAVVSVVRPSAAAAAEPPSRWTARYDFVLMRFVMATESLAALACSEVPPQAIGQWSGPRVVFSPEQIARQSDLVRRFADIPEPRAGRRRGLIAKS